VESGVISEWYFGERLTTEWLILELVVAGVVVVLAGTRLTRLADYVADKRRLGGALIGVILLATVTSLPEVVTGVTATWIGNADLAFAGILGSCSFNVVLIVLLNAVIGGGSILRGGEASHVLTSAFGIILLSLTLLGMVLVTAAAPQEIINARLTEGLWALLIGIVYLYLVSLVCKYEVARSAVPAGEGPGPPEGVEGGVWLQLAVVSAVIVAAGWWLAESGDVLSGHPIQALGRPLGATLVGVIFVAAATSLPEVATSVAAVRMGNLNLALGNIFGSNMFNIFIVPILKLTSLARGDVLLMQGPGFHFHQNLVSGLLPILLTAIAVGGLTFHSHRRILRRFGLDSALLAVVYLGGVMMLMGMGQGE